MLKTEVGKTMTWLLLAAAIAIIGLLGVYYWDTMQELDNTSLPSWVPVHHVTPTPTTTVTPTTTTDATTGWKTYTNSTYGFSIKYPSSWTVKDTIQKSGSAIPATNYLSVKKGNTKIRIIVNVSGFDMPKPEIEYTAKVTNGKLTLSNRTINKDDSSSGGMGMIENRLSIYDFKINNNNYTIFADGVSSTDIEKEVVQIFETMQSVK